MTNSDPSSRSLRLLLELGRGGMGVVYLALHQGPGGFSKLKVVKRLRPDLSNEPAAVEMFLEEGRLSARLHHPNVVQTNEVGFDGKHYFLEMEYLEGQTFEAFTKRARATATTRVTGHDRAVAVWILAQALAGLHYAHELADHQGAALRVVHRDVSPHNVFVTYDGEVKVLDFGIAKAADSQHETQTGVLKGKVTYMAPEQVARKALDRRADVFAAGVILWQILSGERLWKDLDDFEIFLKLRTEAIPSPSSVNDDVPDALEAACMRALAHNPEERTPTAAEMKRELEAWLESSGFRVGPKEVAAQMEELFARDRAETKTEIDQRIRTTPANESVVGVPMLRMPAERGTADGLITANTVPGEGTRVRQQQQIRGLRTIAMGAMGIAVVASVAASVATLRNRHARALAAAADAGAVAAVPLCSNRKCSEAHGGEPWVCRASDHECVAVDSEDCKAMYEKGDLVADDTVWLGAMFPMKGPDADEWGKMNMDGVDFARSDVARVTRSLGGAGATQRARHIAVVGCDDSGDAMRAAKHMVEDVGVPAIIGFQSGSEIVNVASNLLIPHGVITMASISPNPSIVRIPQPNDIPRMVWRTTINHDSFARATAHFIHESLEPKAALSARTMRVALVRDDTAGPLSFAATFYRTLVFNGKSALENGHDYLELPVGDDSATERQRVSGIVSEANPDVIVLIVTSEKQLSLVQAMEAAIKSKGHPTYVLVNSPTTPLKTFVGTNAERRHRVFGVGELTSSTPNARFVIRYNQARHATVTRDENPGVSYDAFYLLSYAALGLAADTPVTGAALARGFAHLMPPGKPIEVGPNDMLEALSVLSSGGQVDLEGTQGGLDFDLTTGEAAWDIGFFCSGVDARGHMTGDDVESGVVYRDKTSHVEGVIRCP